MSDGAIAFVDRHGLWNDGHHTAASEMRDSIDAHGIEMVRVVFVDQHGILRGKTITRAALDGVMASGITVPSSLLLKDLSGKSVFNPFAADPGVGVAGMAGAGDIVLVPDPTTFVTLPWARRTGQVLCDVYFPNGDSVPFCTRTLLRQVLGKVADHGYRMIVGPELEFHVFVDRSPDVQPEQIGAPGAPGAAPDVGAVTVGSQLLHVETLDGLDDVIQAMHDALVGMGLPLRSLELEFGPSQIELTLDAADAAASADAIVLCRSAIRQVCSRQGFRATFMSRPAGADTASAGWHLHQSLTDLRSDEPAFMPVHDGEVLSEVGYQYLAGLLANADATTAFSTPTVNGYKRYRPFSLAPDRKVWGIDNKGAMVRAVGRAGDRGSRLENRSGEPGANPYLYIASQAVAGLDGIDRSLTPGDPVTEAYSADAAGLPANLAVALDALDGSDVFRTAFGNVVVDWYLGLKRAEFSRYLNHVSDWEQREYLGLL